MSTLDNYLKSFDYAKNLTNPELWKEMDHVWDTLHLDNRVKFSQQNIGEFYGHHVWVLNGLFSEIDHNSYLHRNKIVQYAINFYSAKSAISVADFGGGSGVLAKIFEDKMENLKKLDIIEPWPSDFFINKLKGYDKLRFTDNFCSDDYYDLIIAQDVLEHVENPIEVAFDCIKASKVGGILIFANCFYPVIKCHLPQNFYLRYLFKFVVTSKNLKYLGRVPGAPHMEVYQKINGCSFNFLTLCKNAIAKVVGPSLNVLSKYYFLLK